VENRGSAAVGTEEALCAGVGSGTGAAEDEAGAGTGAVEDEAGAGTGAVEDEAGAGTGAVAVADCSFLTSVVSLAGASARLWYPVTIAAGR
jgi:hypothetical protein